MNNSIHDEKKGYDKPHQACDDYAEDKDTCEVCVNLALGVEAHCLRKIIRRGKCDSLIPKLYLNPGGKGVSGEVLAPLFLSRRPRRTTIGEPSATNAVLGGFDNASTN